MPGLLDFIFENIRIGELDRPGVLAYTKYLSEIFQNNLSVDQMIRYQRVKVQLGKRLMELDEVKMKKSLQFYGRTSPLF